MKYGLLHYRGDLTRDIREGQLLGHDELYRPYAVTEVEYTPPNTEAEEHFDGDGCTFPTEGHFLPSRTTVWLQTASGEQIKAASLEEFKAATR